MPWCISSSLAFRRGNIKSFSSGTTWRQQLTVTMKDALYWCRMLQTTTSWLVCSHLDNVETQGKTWQQVHPLLPARGFPLRVKSCDSQWTASLQLQKNIWRHSEGVSATSLMLLCVQNSNGLCIPKFIMKSKPPGDLKLFDAALILWADQNKTWLYNFGPSQGQGFLLCQILFYALSHKFPLDEFTNVVYVMELKADRQKQEPYLLTLSLCSSCFVWVIFLICLPRKSTPLFCCKT